MIILLMSFHMVILLDGCSNVTSSVYSSSSPIEIPLAIDEILIFFLQSFKKIIISCISLHSVLSAKMISFNIKYLLFE